MCLDVDAYDDKPGRATLAALVAVHGELPKTVIATARELPSGRYLYRVPNGTRLRSSAGPGIDMCQFHHRYVVVWPSIHHTGARVKWVDELSGEQPDTIPDPGELPELPWSWIEALSVSGSREVAAAADDDTVRAWCEDHTTERRPGWLPVVINGARADITARKSRHDTVLAAACQMAREASAGAYTASNAVTALKTLWADVMTDDDRATGRNIDTELAHLIGWAVGQLNTDTSRDRVDAIRAKLGGGSCGATPSATDDDPSAVLRLPSEFWNERPSLTHIRAAAARMCPPDVVLHVVLARAAALTSHTVELPPIVGGGVGLSYLTMLCGRPEDGKSTSIATGRELMPAPVNPAIADGLPLGSGEGLAEVLYGTVTEQDPDTGKPTKVRRQVRHNALVAVDEGTLLAELSERRGSTVLTTLRSIFSHGTIGNTNASAERHRVIPGDRYVFGVIVGIQPALAGPLFTHAAISAGTSQRFAWCWCIDPTITADPADWPGPLNWTPPTPGDLARCERIVNPGATIRHRLHVPADIQREMRHGIHKARTETDRDLLDAHRQLVRLKVAAQLGILDDRVGVTPDDWRLAGIVTDTSRHVRRHVVAELRAVEAAKSPHKSPATSVGKPRAKALPPLGPLPPPPVPLAARATRPVGT